MALLWGGALAICAQEDTARALDRLQREIAANAERLESGCLPTR